MTKKFINKNIFPCHKNLNWKILTKNLVTFKRWDGVKDEKFNIMGENLEIWFLGGVHEEPIYRGKLWNCGIHTMD